MFRLKTMKNGKRFQGWGKKEHQQACIYQLPDILVTSLIAGAGANSIAHAEPSALVCHDPDEQTKEIFRPYRVFCARKDVSFIFSPFSCSIFPLQNLTVLSIMFWFINISKLHHKTFLSEPNLVFKMEKRNSRVRIIIMIFILEFRAQTSFEPFINLFLFLFLLVHRYTARMLYQKIWTYLKL